MSFPFAILFAALIPALLIFILLAICVKVFHWNSDTGKPTRYVNFSSTPSFLASASSFGPLERNDPTRAAPTAPPTMGQTYEPYMAETNTGASRLSTHLAAIAVFGRSSRPARPVSVASAASSFESAGWYGLYGPCTDANNLTPRYSRFRPVSPLPDLLPYQGGRQMIVVPSPDPRFILGEESDDSDVEGEENVATAPTPTLFRPIPLPADPPATTVAVPLVAAPAPAFIST